MNETIGQRLKRIREKLGMNQSQFSKEFGISQQSVSRYENDQIDISDDLKIDLIKYNVNINWLLSGVGDMSMDHTGVKNEEELTIDDCLQLLQKIKRVKKIDKSKLIDFIESLLMRDRT